MLEIRVPISPTRSFYKQVEALAASAAYVGAPGWDVRMVVSVGERELPGGFPQFPATSVPVTWRPIPRDAFERDGYVATIADRLSYSTDADVVLFADADVLITGRIDQVLADVAQRGLVAGVIAHAAPPCGSPWSWEGLFTEAGARPIQAWHQHTGWPFMAGEDAERLCPAYYNFGAVFAAAPALEPLGGAFEKSLEVTVRAGFGYFSAQVALAVAIGLAEVPTAALGMRHNFPNDPLFETALPEELAGARLVHYLRTPIIDRARIWESSLATMTLLNRTDLAGANDLVRRTIRALVQDGRVAL